MLEADEEPGAIRTLIADDESLARRGIRAKLQAHPDVHVIGECEHGIQTVQRIREEQPDLVLLDIHMPGLDGIEVAKAIGRENRPAVVVVSAHREHAVDAFGIDAADYLLKPVDDERLAEALDRVRGRIRWEGSSPSERPATEVDDRHAGSGTPYLQWLLVKRERHAFFVPVEDVDWVGTADNYLSIHVGRTSHLIRGRMTQLEHRLDPDVFVRIHRQTLVNRERIERVFFDETGQPWVLMRDETRLRISRSYRAALLDQRL